MSWIEITLGGLLLISAVSIISMVLLQEAEQQNPGSITPTTSGTFFSQNESRSIDAFYKRWTKIIAVSFFLLVVTLNVVTFILKKSELNALDEQVKKFKEQSQQVKNVEEGTGNEDSDDAKKSDENVKTEGESAEKFNENTKTEDDTEKSSE
ncbi:MAG: preprotein translocase subunit SecG [Oscillospiraceae bacterium]|jgi:preprotein translocase subunit SecG|nr:preprotein translocase subunit SecG [Oscillospiraceae bacterium]